MDKKLHLAKLDAIRGFAAFYVVIHHFFQSTHLLPKSIEKIFFSFGQEAVILFFLLSGFVIYLSSHRISKGSFRSYFIKRFRRIYFPFIVAIALSAVIFLLNGSFDKYFSWRELFGNLFLLQDFSTLKPGIWVRPFLGNLPLWSLSYEWWFYMMFYPLYRILPRDPRRIYLVLFVSMLAYTGYTTAPNYAALVLSYFIIWWAGVESAAVFLKDEKFTFQNTKHILLSLFLMMLFTIIPVLGADNIRFGYYPFLMFRHFFTAFAVVGIGLLWYQIKLKNFDRIFGIFTGLAPISYGLYIFHYPILIQWKPEDYISNFGLVLGLKLVLLVGLAYLTEIVLQPIVNRLLNDKPRSGKTYKQA